MFPQICIDLFSAIDFAKKIFLDCTYQLCSFVSPIFVLGPVHRHVIHIPLFSSVLNIFIMPFWLCFPFYSFRLNLDMFVEYIHKCLGKGFKVLICIYLRNVKICHSRCHVCEKQIFFEFFVRPIFDRSIKVSFSMRFASVTSELYRKMITYSNVWNQ